MADGPVTATLVADTAQTVSIDGVWNSLEIIPVATATQVVWAIGDGTVATKGTGKEYVAAPYWVTRIPTKSTDGITTSVSIISATAGQVQVRFPTDNDD